MSQRGNPGDDDRFRVRPSKPRQRGDTFIAQVLRQTSKAAGVSGRGRKTTGKPPVRAWGAVMSQPASRASR